MQKLKEIKEKFDKSTKINYNNLNDILIILKKILKIFLLLIVVLTAYITVKVFKELNIINIIFTILSILKPFFIGIIIAWLLNPFVNFLKKKGVRRIIGTTLSYVILMSVLFIIIYSIIPIAYDQLSDLSSTVPVIIDNANKIIDNILNKFNGVAAVDIIAIKDKLYGSIDGVANGIYNTLPIIIVNVIKEIVSGTGTFLLGLLIGFFLTLGFNNIGDSLLIFIPKKFQVSASTLFDNINKVLRGYVTGAIFDSSIIFIACSICFFLVGLKSPILFALFCGIMNIIPYAGPYIGAIPALIVAFSQSFTIGIGVAIAIIVIQVLEGNILSPIVMSKTTKLHPVSIIVGLLIFGHFFGILGMLLSTPIISVLKVIVEFIDSKLHILSDNEEDL